jgi:hypothetical protein
MVNMNRIVYLHRDGPALGKIADPHFSRILSTVSAWHLRIMGRPCAAFLLCDDAIPHGRASSTADRCLSVHITSLPDTSKVSA